MVLAWPKTQNYHLTNGGVEPFNQCKSYPEMYHVI